jgi:hypothetical protein
MKPSTSAVEPFGLDTTQAAAAVIYKALAGVWDAHATICSPDTAWFADVRELLPNLPPPDARFVALVLMLRRASQLQQRAFDFLTEELKADPSLEQLLDAVADQDAELLTARREARGLPAFWQYVKHAHHWLVNFNLAARRRSSEAKAA